LRARQLARQLARSYRRPAQVRLAWSPGQAAPYHIEAHIDLNGAWQSLARSSLPARDWFAIETIFCDLRLQHVRWAEAVLEGYFASLDIAWESQ
jgi:hypothetical protein